MKERTFANSEYRYGFNGKENDNDLGDKQLIQDYGFRLYSPSIVKFLSVDPLTKGYPMLTPYQFSSNNPILFIDLDGLEGEWFMNTINRKVEALTNSFNKKVEALNKTIDDRVENPKVLISDGLEATESVAKPFVIVGSGVIMPIAQQLYIGYKNPAVARTIALARFQTSE